METNTKVKSLKILTILLLVTSPSLNGVESQSEFFRNKIQIPTPQGLRKMVTKFLFGGRSDAQPQSQGSSFDVKSPGYAYSENVEPSVIIVDGISNGGGSAPLNNYFESTNQLDGNSYDYVYSPSSFTGQTEIEPEVTKPKPYFNLGAIRARGSYMYQNFVRHNKDLMGRMMSYWNSFLPKKVTNVPQDTSGEVTSHSEAF